MTYYIFIDGKEKEGKLGINSRYRFALDTLTIYRKDIVTFCVEAHEGDGFAAMCDRGKVIVKKMVPPQRNGRFIAWLLNYQKHNRADSKEEYERKLAKYQERYDWSEYEDWEYCSNGYIFTRCNSPYTDEPRNVAGFFSDAITKAEVLQLIPLMNYHPDWYIKGILKERFNVTEEEFDEARKNKF